MRIQNNITAMNTHRMYTINNDNVAKSAEKLSSGYRINRAGDDAAGLAISEKMRSQIRGLNMATKNSQDAISLVQTAEGALQETHSMLQRMNELAVQAATGTNQEEDRMALAKEFEQLKKEINDIAEQTTFNNMKVLDGSMSYAGYVRSAQTAGVTNTVTENSVDSAKAAVVPTNQATAGQSPATGSTATTIAGATIAQADATSALNQGDSWSLTITLQGDTANGGTDTVLEWSGTVTDAAGSTFDAEVNAAGATAVNGWTVSIASSGANRALTLTNTTTGETKYVTTGGATVDYDIAGTQASGNAGNITNGTGTAGTAEVSTATVNLSKLAKDDQISIGGVDYTITQADVDAIAAGTFDMDDLAAKFATASGVKVEAMGTAGLSVTQTTPAATTDAAAYKDTSIEFTAAADANAADTDYKYTNTIEFDTVKMKDGDAFTILGEEVKFEDVAKGEGDTTTANNMAAAFADALKDVEGISVEAKGNALIIKSNTKLEIGTGKQIDLTTDATQADATKTDYQTNAIRIQVGALEDEQLAVSIDSMNTAGLKLDDQDLFTQNNAGRAITAVRAAVQKVSDQRATLGAMQNRLDHKIANLKVSSENLSAAESRIRDVDMAEEMTNFTKNNILSQAATAMLAQANALPQNVLSLLG